MYEKTILFRDTHRAPVLGKSMLGMIFAGALALTALAPQAAAAQQAPQTTAAVEKAKLPETAPEAVIYFMQKGGWVMWPLLAGLIIGSAILAERLVKIRKSHEKDPEKLLNSIIQGIDTKDIESAIYACQRSNSALAQVFKEGLKKYGLPKQEIENHMLKMYDKKIRVIFQQHMSTLQYISAKAPVAGAFGTILGLVQIFGAMQLNGAGTAALYGGMMVALFTSLFGQGIHMVLEAGITKIDNSVADIDHQIDLNIMELFEHMSLKELEQRQGKPVPPVS